MMKSGFLLLFSLLAIYETVVCQEPSDGVFPLKEGKIYYERIYSIDSASKDEIYDRVKFWVISSMTSIKSTLETEDRLVGYIVYKTGFSVPFESPSYMGVKLPESYWNYDFVINYQIKDFKAKVSIYGLTLAGSDNTYTNGESSILNYRKVTEGYSKGLIGSKKYNAKFYAEVKNNFSTANLKLLEILESIRIGLSSKSIRDF